jgi:hypothetical protein
MEMNGTMGTALVNGQLTNGATTVKAGRGVQSSLLGTVKDASGREVTYNHWRLYTFSGDSGPVGDSAPGQANGNGLNLNGGLWHEVPASG